MHFICFLLFFVSQDAVCTLNTLQTNASALDQVRRERGHPRLQLVAMESFLERSGLTVSRSHGVQSTFAFEKTKWWSDERSWWDGRSRLVGFISPCFYLSCLCVKGGRPGSAQYHSCDGNKGQGGLSNPLYSAGVALWLTCYEFTFRLRSRTLEPVFTYTPCKKSSNIYIFYDCNNKDMDHNNNTRQRHKNKTNRNIKRRPGGCYKTLQQSKQ